MYRIDEFEHLKQKYSEKIIDEKKWKIYEKPVLGYILVGNREDSEMYVRSKKHICEQIGLECVGFDLPINCSEQQVCELVRQMNDDPKINGIMIQLPLPQRFDENKILDLIDPKKDVDGFHPVNIGNLALKGRDPDFISCTPLAVYELLKEYCLKSGDFSDQNITICGKSNIVGMPLSLLLSKNNATVSLCHSKTKNIEDFVRQADILITAIGQKHFFKGELFEEIIIIWIVIMRNKNQKISRNNNMRV
eukprot:403351379